MTNNLTPEQLAEIKRLDGARTKGEWYVEPPSGSNIIRVMRPGREEGDPGLGQMQFYEWWNEDGTHNDLNELHRKNAEFAAAASWAVPALVREVERLRSEFARMQDSLDQDYIDLCDSAAPPDDPQGLIWWQQLRQVLLDYRKRVARVRSEERAK